MGGYSHRSERKTGNAVFTGYRIDPVPTVQWDLKTAQLGMLGLSGGESFYSFKEWGLQLGWLFYQWWGEFKNE